MHLKPNKLPYILTLWGLSVAPQVVSMPVKLTKGKIPEFVKFLKLKRMVAIYLQKKQTRFN